MTDQPGGSVLRECPVPWCQAPDPELWGFPKATGSWRVTCRKCGFETHRPYPTEAEAIAAWNARSEPLSSYEIQQRAGTDDWNAAVELGTVPLSVYESAVKGRQDFRAAFRRCRDALKPFAAIADRTANLVLRPDDSIVLAAITALRPAPSLEGPESGLVEELEARDLAALVDAAHDFRAGCENSWAGDELIITETVTAAFNRFNGVLANIRKHRFAALRPRVLEQGEVDPEILRLVSCAAKGDNLLIVASEIRRIIDAALKDSPDEG